MTNITVFVLADQAKSPELLELTLTSLGAEEVEGLRVHVVPPASGEPPAARRPFVTAAHTAPGRAVNDLLARDRSEVLFLVTSGSVVHPEDLAEAALVLQAGDQAVLTGCTHDVTASDEHVRRVGFWRSLRVAGVGNRLDVSESASAVSLLGMNRRTYVSLRGLDEATQDPVSALVDLQARALRAGVSVDAGPLVLRLAHRLNALNQSRDRVATNAERSATRSPIYRNLTRTIGNPEVDAPAISIVISTFNRAKYLGDCINSILAQSMPDFELVLIDDGSTDDTEVVVAGFDDPRIRYIKRENAGISAARNFGLAEARGTFVAVHDDDDIMLPWRLGTQLRMLQPGDHGCFGISVHFDEVTGETHKLVHRLFNMSTALRYGDNPTHPTWLVRRDVMAAFGYDETLESGVDNNLALRMVRSGVRMSHCGVPLILRRVHAGQITRTAGETQKASASMSRRMLQFANGATPSPSGGTAGEWLPSSHVDDRIDRVLPFLPDDLVRRAVTIRIAESPSNARVLAEKVGELQFMRTRFGAEDEGEAKTVLMVTNVTWGGLAALRRAGAELEVTVLDEAVRPEHAMDGALESWSTEEAGLADKGGHTFVRAISHSRYNLDKFIGHSGLTGWAYFGVDEGKERMAVLFEMPDLASAITLCGKLEGNDLNVSEISILSRNQITEDAMHQVLIRRREVHA